MGALALAAEGLRVYVTAPLGRPVLCACGRPLCTPTSAVPLTAPLVLDYLVCPKCRAHVLLTLMP